MTTRPRADVTILVLAAIAGCADSPLATNTPAEGSKPRSHSPALLADGPYMFPPAVFDIDAAPDGSILVAGNTVVQEIRAGGTGHVMDIPAAGGAGVNGIAAKGRGNFFVTTGGPDLAVGAGVWHVTQGRARLVGNIETFETKNDPDAFAGPQWKNPVCETLAGFTAGPQSNPFHVLHLTGNRVLVADAAGNTLLTAGVGAGVDLVALFTPPVDQNGDWMVLASLGPGTECYVQPVPTSVDVGPDGAMYVGELIGVTPAELGGATAAPLSRVWRIEPGARNTVCPSSDCSVALSDLTSIIDLAFGPDGMLYVVEYDETGWFAATAPPFNAGGGTVNRCDVISGSCTPVAQNLTLPGAITFDKWGRLWLLENNIIAPTVRVLDLP